MLETHDPAVISAIDAGELRGRVEKDDELRTVAHVDSAAIEAWRASHSSSVDQVAA